jgi:hypothetical protein
MQTEGQAFRRAIETTLSADAILSRILSGGWHFDLAPQVDTRTGSLPAAPYAVFQFLAMPESKGNAGRRIIVSPLLRFTVHGEGIGSSIRQKCMLCSRRIDTLLLSLSVTVTDDIDPVLATDDDFKVDPFRREQGIDQPITDGTGTTYTRIGGDYRGSGYYVNC